MDGTEALLEQRLRVLAAEVETRQTELGRIEAELRRRRDLADADLQAFLHAKETRWLVV